jgi:hypothetical protein
LLDQEPLDDEDLRQDQVPPAGSDWWPIWRFALSTDGYRRLEFGDLAALANGARARYRDSGEFPGDLASLRLALFFEQRRYRHLAQEPDGEDERYVRGLVEAIRRVVARRAGKKFRTSGARHQDRRIRIVKDTHEITCVEDWAKFAPPKRANQWTPGRSAYELARAWCGGSTVRIPAALTDLLENAPQTKSLRIESVTPELAISFDAFGGEPRNADLAFLASGPEGLVAVTIEAKADEPFGDSVADTLAGAIERGVRNPRSQGVRRVEALARALFHAREKGQASIGALRYQLLTAAAGSLAYAHHHGAAVAVLVIHEFVTSKTSAAKHQRNGADLQAFLQRLGGAPAGPQFGLAGPFPVPGSEMFGKAPLFIGKITTHT